MKVTEYLSFSVSDVGDAVTQQENILLTEIKPSDIPVEVFDDFIAVLKDMGAEHTSFSSSLALDSERVYVVLKSEYSDLMQASATWVHRRGDVLANKEGILALEIAGRENLIRSLLLDKL